MVSVVKTVVGARREALERFFGLRTAVCGGGMVAGGIWKELVNWLLLLLDMVAVLILLGLPLVIIEGIVLVYDMILLS